MVDYCEWYEVVSKGKVAVRAEPLGEAEALGLLTPGAKVAVTEAQGPWLLVRLPLEVEARAR